MLHLGRPALGLLFLTVAAIAPLTYDFADRGRAFAPEAKAKTDRTGTYDLARARTLTKVIGYVRTQYVDPTRVNAKEMAVSAVQAVQMSVPEVMVEVVRNAQKTPTSLKIRVANAEQEFTLTRVGDLYELNWKLMDIFDFFERHLPPFRDLEALEYAAVGGLLETLDPHTMLLTPRVYREMQLGTRGRFGGLGIVVSARDGRLQVMSVMEGTPAQKAGMLSGDIIVRLGEESTINMPLNDAVSRMRGAPGTPCVLWIEREGEDAPRPVTIIREEIRVRSVTHHDLGEGLGYVRIHNFQATTIDDLDEALARLTPEGGALKGLILDLRENPGGLLEQAIAVSDRFLATGTIVATVREGAKEREERHAKTAETLSDMPIVVLINRGSASASEIVAGALKHGDRALVVGTTSFGKGSVQVVYRIDEAALKLTIAQYLTPGDISIQGVGIVPDIEVRTLDATKEGLDLRPADLDQEGEAGLSSHLDSNKTTTVKPALTLTLLKDGREGVEGGAAGRYADFKADALVDLSVALLGAAPSPRRSQALVQAQGFIAQRQAMEQVRLAEALTAIPVDWTEGPTPSKHKVGATLTLDLAVNENTATGAASPKTPPMPADGPAAFSAGDTIVVTATVTNKGRRAVHRIHGILDSEIGALNGREMVFGRLEAGETRTFTMERTLPRSLVSQADRVVLALFSDGERLGKGHAAQRDLAISARPKGRFAWSARVVDAKGSGDGLIQRGESVTVEVRVKNVGLGDAEDLLLTLKNESGEHVFITAGRHRAGVLKRGEETRARFEIEVREGLKTQDVQLELSLLDQGLRTWSHGEIVLPVFPKAFPRAVAEGGFVRVAGQAGKAALRAGAHRNMRVVAKANVGAVLPVLARAGNWIHVGVEPAGEGTPWSGWIPVEETQSGGDMNATGATFEHIAPHWQEEPPEILLTHLAPTALWTAAKAFTLSGHARFAPQEKNEGAAEPSDIYIFRNDDKVFFQSATQVAGEEAFSTSIPLVAGRNILTVIARRGADDVARKRIVVFRSK